MTDDEHDTLAEDAEAVAQAAKRATEDSTDTDEIVEAGEAMEPDGKV